MRLVILMLLLATIPLASLLAYAQPSSVPPSSLPVTPLSPSLNDPTGVGSCDLCRPLEGRRGSDLERHRRLRDPDLHLHKKTPGMTKSLKRNFKSQLPHHKLEERQDGVER
ncbi:MAG TPA: hypothetical protein VFX36_08445 [Nitrospira sp.]|nr:hypothetical protein [Nitrospira sp.]